MTPMLGPGRSPDQWRCHQIEAFLTVAEELHFGRAAERLFLSQPRTSRLVSALEREIGGQLFVRTSRRVALTALGESFRDTVAPPYAQLGAVLRAAHDVLVNWLALGEEAGLVAGPVIERRRRMLAVGRSHRLAGRPEVSVEEIAAEQVCTLPPPFPRELRDALCPPATPGGKPVDRSRLVHSSSEALDLVARREAVHLTVDSMVQAARHDIVLVPVCDLPPLALGLIWARSGENELVSALARIARRLGRNRPDPASLPGY